MPQPIITLSSDDIIDGIATTKTPTIRIEFSSDVDGFSRTSISCASGGAAGTIGARGSKKTGQNGAVFFEVPITLSNFGDATVTIADAAATDTEDATASVETVLRFELHRPLVHADGYNVAIRADGTGTFSTDWIYFPGPIRDVQLYLRSEKTAGANLNIEATADSARAILRDEEIAADINGNTINVTGVGGTNTERYDVMATALRLTNEKSGDVTYSARLIATPMAKANK